MYHCKMYDKFPTDVFENLKNLDHYLCSLVYFKPIFHRNTKWIHQIIVSQF